MHAVIVVPELLRIEVNLEHLQSDSSGRLLAYVDIKTKVLSQYRILILKSNIQFDVNKSSYQPDGSPCTYIWITFP